MIAQTINYSDVIAPLPPNSTLILHDISWEEYEDLIDSAGENRSLRFSYDGGTLIVMTLSSKHEKFVELIKMMIASLSVRLRVKVLCFGSATMKKQRREKGAEPDACFYVQNADLVGKKDELDFSKDPPPDFVVEVDISHDSLSKFPIYAALEVPEIWRYDEQALTIYHLRKDQYVAADASRALPLLTGKALTEFLSRSPSEDQYEILLKFEDWLQTLKS